MDSLSANQVNPGIKFEILSQEPISSVEFDSRRRLTNDDMEDFGDKRT